MYFNQPSFLTDTTLRDNPRPFRTLNELNSTGAKSLFSLRLCYLIETKSREYITSIITKSFVIDGGIDRRTSLFISGIYSEFVTFKFN